MEEACSTPEKELLAQVQRGCAVCQTLCAKFCSGCKKAYYCSVDHQKSHRKQHKKHCFPAVLQENEGLGRCFVASRDIKQGEFIFKDKALVSGPSGAELFFHPICLGCYKQVKTLYKCSKCGWPICSKQCEDMKHHADYECKIFAEKEVKPYFTKPYQYEWINTLRSLLLIHCEPEKWEELAQLASHAEARANNQAALRTVMESVDFIHSVCKLGDQFASFIINHVVGIWGINSFGANPPAGPNPGRSRMATLMFPKLCLAAHNCTPNTRGILVEDVKTSNPTYSMELIASLPIKEGEQIHTTYANVNEGTFERRLVLRDNYYFYCECKRCSDPTEFRTFFSAFKCLKCPTGYLIPNDPLDLDTVWRCTDKCPSSVTYSDLKIIINKIKREVHGAGHESNALTIKRLEGVLKKFKSKILHANHWIMVETEFILAQRILGYLPRCLKSEEEDFLLNRLAEVSEHCLTVADLVQPGHNTYRGKLLYILTQGRLKKLVKSTKKCGLDTILQSRNLLASIRSSARESMEILSREPDRTEDQLLSQKLGQDLVQVQSMLELFKSQDGSKIFF